ncbi:NAD-dependent epimerase/dehydratase family protein [Rhodococcus sp. G-MC3]|uniref:NAD-dependent epimerase/dehydratase family protein n=1 Tax=Rhodococcus sp. G-MC3 TaxID=3046209 RepID=UPI0024BBCC94|nr:NAD-dependent epimerase/dehydratase family protein [Rhodococcus sp. G-MC3]MDJ0395887.1 NAD-dependent epimerase/dehydratase family protein [Rhodococcus sp. G-MC3]
MTLRIAVTGATSDFAKAILPTLLDDDEVGSVLGLARRPLGLEHPKLESVRADIRSPELENIFSGCDVVLHLAFVVEELRDKTETHDINQRGSRNVLDSAYRAGVRRLVIASSINAYGAELHDEPLDESFYPAGDPDRYYFHDKAEVEHYAEWWLRRHPGEMTVAMLRPTYIIGPDFSNDGIDQFTAKIGAFPQADKAAYQFLHQRDLADAFHRAAKQDLVGPFNVGPRDWTRVRELADMQGQILFDVPEGPAIAAANVAFKLGLTPFSGQWVTAGEPVVDSSALRSAVGWEPVLSSRECAAIMVLLQGRPLLGSQYALTRHEACEAALEPASAVVGIEDGHHEHVQLDTATGRVHCEVHRRSGNDAGRAGAIVVPVRPGLHARYLTPLARELANGGSNVVLLDLPGHGLSTGPRGRVSAREFDSAVDAAISFARSQFGSPVTAYDVGETRQETSTLRTLFSALRRPSNESADGLIPRNVHAPVSWGTIPTVGTAADIIDALDAAPTATTSTQTRSLSAR